MTQIDVIKPQLWGTLLCLSPEANGFVFQVQLQLESKTAPSRFLALFTEHLFGSLTHCLTERILPVLPTASCSQQEDITYWSHQASPGTAGVQACSYCLCARSCPTHPHLRPPTTTSQVLPQDY